ncbi:MAG: hypothetical protein ABI999_04155 [Acidobacteriota bacterium]
MPTPTPTELSCSTCTPQSRSAAPGMGQNNGTTTPAISDHAVTKWTVKDVCEGRDPDAATALDLFAK